MKILDKKYRGVFYIIAFIVSLLVTILTSQQVTDLHLPWVGPALQALAVIALLVQRFTSIGDKA